MTPLPLGTAAGTEAAQTPRSQATPQPAPPDGEPSEHPPGTRPAGAPPSGARPSGAPPSGAHPSGAQPSGAQPSGAHPFGERPFGERRFGERRPSVRSRAISGALRLGVFPFLHHVPGRARGLRTARSTVDAASLLMRHTQRVRVRPLYDPQVEVAGVRRPVVGEWVVTRGAEEESPPGAILYLHGGGYVVCSPRTHRPITSRLALDTGLPVLAARYRLAPEHPFPAPLEDALAAYRWLLTRGIPASGIVVAGDSAGGHLAAALTAEICRAGLPRPAGTVLFSPWVDLTCELSTRAQHGTRDAYISASAAQRVARLVVGPAGFDDPRLALLTCGWDEAPPVLIQVGGAEVLRPEAEALAEALAAAGADCELQVWKGQMHVFQILNRVLPEANAAMRETARFVRDVTAGADAALGAGAVA
ncbi:alpha/beta hydrolase fold domain-containing protein [Actinomadura yumaensis]|uniref:alpha/beta hydrolase n=1 Tax=Actinomadura TaxID=1988 RepID=UPI0028150E59|nr:alpha/beta hydrolase fold domain-containing protein [Actinomadura sp. J1-007]